MLVQSKVQISREDYEFMKKAFKEFRYKSLSEYMREAISNKVREDRKKLRDLKRMEAMEMIGRTHYENLFESIEGEDFESR